MSGSVSDGPDGTFRVIPQSVFPPRRAGLLTISRVDDFEFYRPPAGRAWPFNDYSKGRLSDRTTLLYWRRQVKPAGDQKLRNPQHIPMRPAHPYDLIIGLKGAIPD